MMNAAPVQSELSIGRYWSILLSRWRVVLVAAVVGVAIAVGYLAVVPSTYVATTTLSVYPITTDPYAANRNRNNLIDMHAEAVTASSFKVAQLAATATGGSWEPAALRKGTSVTVAPDSTIMTISVESGSEASARSGASAVAEAYLQSRSEQAATSIDSVVERDRERIDGHRQQLTNAIERLAAAEPGSSAAAEASADQQLLNLQISSLLARISALEGIDTTGGTILNPANMTAVAVAPSRVNTLLTGCAAGFVFGVIAAFVMHSRRRSVRSARSLSRELDLESLGVIDADMTESSVATVAQRVLREAERNSARVVAIVFERAVEWPSPLVERIAGSMTKAGTPTVVLPPIRSAEASLEQLVLVPVASDAPTDLRLHALRVSSMSILIAAIGATTFRSLSALVEDGDEMGAAVAGAVLVPREAPRGARQEKDPSESSDRPSSRQARNLAELRRSS